MTFNNDKLKDIDRRLFDKFGHLYYASLAYLGIKVLDITSTSLYLHKQSNLNVEANDLTKSKHKRLAQNTLSDTSVSATKLMVERESCAKPYLTGYFPG
jgi:hypothetical protein